MNYLIFCFNILFLGIVAYVFRDRGEMRIFYWPALVVKVLAGIAVGLVYFYYYRVGDTLIFYEDGKILADVARRDFLRYIGFLWNENTDIDLYNQIVSQDRSLFMVKIVSLFSFFTGNNYWLISTYFSILSFFSCWFLLATIQKAIPGIVPAAIFSFLFFPSVIFWSAGIIKECIAMAALLFLSSIFLKVWFKSRLAPGEIILAFAGSWLLWNLKYYYAAVFFLIIFTSLFYRFFVWKKLFGRNPVIRILAWLIIFLIPLSIAFNAHPNFRPARILNVITDNYIAFIDISSPEDIIHYRNLSPTPGSILVHSPKALFSGLFRPLPWEATTLFQVLVSIENLAILVLSILAVFNFSSFIKAKHRLLVFTVLVYVGMLCVFISLSTPNFGTLSRYRVSYLPFWILLVSSVSPFSTFLQRSYRRLVRYKR